MRLSGAIAPTGLNTLLSAKSPYTEMLPLNGDNAVSFFVLNTLLVTSQF